MSKKIHYSNNDITIIWEQKICTHAAECVKRLPKVYKPKERPWITTENATTEELKEQIYHCPSGALTFTEKK
ncbi:MAG: (4Fe-4S)-binding protein [Flavobacteriales bacterium]|nr:(4Fe-4S)-binding protein [Flavobacteriales bacterium]